MKFSLILLSIVGVAALAVVAQVTMMYAQFFAWLLLIAFIGASAGIALNRRYGAALRKRLERIEF